MKTSRVTLLGSALIIGLALASCKKEGCTDPLAINYDSNANHDNGSCSYDPNNPGGGGGGGGTTNTITSDITTPTTLSGVVAVCGDIDLEAAVTIQAGTVLNMCAGASLRISATGSLSSEGSVTSPVIIQGETNSAGFWDGIEFASNNPNNNLQYTIISDAGGYWAFSDAAIYVKSQSQLAMSNSTVTNCSADGLYTSETATLNNFISNTFSNNGNFGINVTANQIGSLDPASDYSTGNANPFVNARAATVNQNQTWPDLSTPILFNGETQITGAVTLEEGANFVFEANSGIVVESSGSLLGIGTSSNPITFAGRFNTPGYWRSVRYESNNPNNQLAYATIMDGGAYWADTYSSLNVTTGARLELNNCTISNSNSWGMYVSSSTTIVVGGATVTDAAGVLSNNTITGNGVGPDANCSGGGCTVLFN
ncbi:MAG: hypothetical protein ACFHU9_07910 [Fluviicola sp.]